MENENEKEMEKENQGSNHNAATIGGVSEQLDQLLEDAPSPFIMQHAVKFSNVRKRVLSLNLLLKSIQRRVDNIDRMLSMGLQHGN
ncbi:hypothetical protein Gotur_014710 [Gossypium turneri]